MVGVAATFPSNQICQCGGQAMPNHCAAVPFMPCLDMSILTVSRLR